MKNLTAFDHQNKDTLDGSFSSAVLIQEIEKLRTLTQSGAVNKRMSEIKISDIFSKIFTIQDDILQALELSMRTHGFDCNHPLLVWEKTYEILDGHTRFQAAKNIGLLEIPVIFVNLEDEKEAKNYIYTLQFQRRNLTVADRFQFLIDHIQENGKPRFFREWIAKIFRVSTGTATKYVRLMDNYQSDEFQKIMKGNLTLNKAYESLIHQENRGGNERKKIHHIRNKSLDYYFEKIKLLSEGKRKCHLEHLKCFILILSENRFLNKQNSLEILEYVESNSQFLFSSKNE